MVKNRSPRRVLVHCMTRVNMSDDCSWRLVSGISWHSSDSWHCLTMQCVECEHGELELYTFISDVVLDQQS